MNLLFFGGVGFGYPFEFKQFELSLFYRFWENQSFNRIFLDCLGTQALLYSLKIQNHGKHGSWSEGAQTLKEVRVEFSSLSCPDSIYLTY